MNLSELDLHKEPSAVANSYMGNKSSKRLNQDEVFLQALTSDFSSAQRFLEERPYYVNKPLTDRLWTALFVACEFENRDLAYFLVIEKKADMEHEDEDLLTPLVYCAYKNTHRSRDLALSLANWGADVGHKTQSGATAIDIARCNRKTKFAAALQKLAEDGPYAKRPSRQILKALWVYERLRRRGSGRLSFGLVREVCSFY